MTWLPFELHPDTPDGGVSLAAYFGMAPDRLTQMHAALRERAGDLGLPFSPPDLLVNTRRAHLLAALVQRQHPAQFEALHRRLFRAYWAEGNNLGEPAVLEEVCHAAGLPRDLVAKSGQDQAAMSHLTESMRVAQRYGITGAPTFILNDHFKVVGAQPYEVLLKAFRQADQNG